MCPIPLGARGAEPGSAGPSFLSFPRCFNPHAWLSGMGLCPPARGTATHAWLCVPKSSAGLLEGSRRVQPGRARLGPARAGFNSLTRDMARDPGVAFVTRSAKVAPSCGSQPRGKGLGDPGTTLGFASSSPECFSGSSGVKPRPAGRLPRSSAPFSSACPRGCV